MLYREAGQFKASYAEDQQIFPIRQDRIAIAGILIVCVLGIIGAGIFAAANGSREFEHHESDHAELAPEGTESGG